MLTKTEREYFNRIRSYICYLFRLSVPIYPLDHRKFIPMRDDESVLGCCHKIRDNDGNEIGHVITIDEPYIRACCHGRQMPYSPYSDNQLIETICHEIAHTQVWAHNEYHKDLTNALHDRVIESLKKAA